jgi:hypothetical protein
MTTTYINYIQPSGNSIYYDNTKYRIIQDGIDWKNNFKKIKKASLAIAGDLSDVISDKVPDFWSVLHKLNWTDSDEIKRNREYLEKTLTKKEIIAIHNRITIMTNELLPLFEETGINYGSTDHNNVINDIISHIIGKGEVYYNYVMLDLNLTLYLKDVYQPLRSILNSVVSSYHGESQLLP